MSSSNKQFNPFYPLTILVGIVFALTAIAYSFSLALVMKAVPGEPIAHASSGFGQALSDRGDMWLLVEVGVLVAVSFLAMGYDRYLILKDERSSLEEES